MVSSRIPFRARKLKREAPDSEQQQTEQQVKKLLYSDEKCPTPNSAIPKSLECSQLVTLTAGDIDTAGELLTVASATLSALESVSAAIEHLKACDARLRSHIEANPDVVPRFQTCSSPFRSLARSIVYQQLATNAATTIYNRLLDLCGGLTMLSPLKISQLSQSELRTAGISARKSSYLHDLARHFLEGGLSDAALLQMKDDQLISALTVVKGIGIWSVNMFMIFDLHRPDILPVGDLGVRKGLLKLYGLKSLPTPTEMEQITASWRPYRSIGSWYMWRVIDTKVPFS